MLDSFWLFMYAVCTKKKLINIKFFVGQRTPQYSLNKRTIIKNNNR